MAIFRPASGGTSGSSRLAGLKILQCILAVNPADSGTPSLTLQSRLKRDSFSDSLLDIPFRWDDPWRL